MIPFLNIRYISENSVSIESLVDKDQIADNGDLFCHFLGNVGTEDYCGIKLVNGFSQLSKEDGVKVGVASEGGPFSGGKEFFDYVIKKDGEDLIFEPFVLNGWISIRFYFKPGEVITVSPNIAFGFNDKSLLCIERISQVDLSELLPPIPPIPDDIW